MHERPFVLLPLVDMQPDLVHPLLRSTVKEILAGLSSSAGVNEETLSGKMAAVGEAGCWADPAATRGAERVLPMGVCGDGETRWVAGCLHVVRTGSVYDVFVRVNSAGVWRDVPPFFPPFCFAICSGSMPTLFMSLGSGR